MQKNSRQSGKSETVQKKEIADKQERERFIKKSTLAIKNGAN